MKSLSGSLRNDFWAPFGTSKSHISLTRGSPDHFWTQKVNFLVLQFSTLFWDPLFKALFELWTNLGMILEVFWHRFGSTFRKRPIFKKTHKNQWYFDDSPCQNDHIFINCSSHFPVPPPGHLKINFFTFWSLFGPPFGTSKSHISLTRGSPNHFWALKSHVTVFQN